MGRQMPVGAENLALLQRLATLVTWPQYDPRGISRASRRLSAVGQDDHSEHTSSVSSLSVSLPARLDTVARVRPSLFVIAYTRNRSNTVQETHGSDVVGCDKQSGEIVNSHVRSEDRRCATVWAGRASSLPLPNAGRGLQGSPCHEPCPTRA